MRLDEYSKHDALGLAELVARRKRPPPSCGRRRSTASPSVNPALNAVLQVLADHERQGGRGRHSRRTVPGRAVRDQGADVPRRRGPARLRLPARPRHRLPARHRVDVRAFAAPAWCWSAPPRRPSSATTPPPRPCSTARFTIPGCAAAAPADRAAARRRRSRPASSRSRTPTTAAARSAFRRAATAWSA